MSECCQNNKEVVQCCNSVEPVQCCEVTQFWNWFSEKEQTFTVDQVKDLLVKVKLFNAGAIDDYLTKHVDKTFVAWAESVKN